MTFDLTGRRALVTGAGHGIGAAIAVTLARAGADIAVHHGHSAGPAGEVGAAIEALGRKTLVRQADLTRTDETQALVDEAAGFLGGLDILVCNAGGMVGRSPVAEMTDEHYQQVVDLNLGTTFRTVRAAIPHLREAGDRGRVVTMSSLAAENGGGAGSVVYAAAKAAVRGLTKGLAKEVAGSGTTVNAVAPGFIGGTAFHDTFTPPQVQRTIVAGVPLGRAGTPGDVAGAVLWLTSDAAGYVTGATIDIDGGAWFR
ncbi:SDR family NAD(P)-dependent oxidoreductase [Micromonospora sp. WMMD1076]|uniref:SDR family NAD(P)-dependent oxidoreductase n=1 Tax=Micromonospora TaxID=1873 RepID=UPI00249A9FE9|nr:SDR family NAD(P)-dependent oxidoreductase [Micromonospora sp. WMMD1076]WFF04494.1 SDR family NAD(P)-dependent oxidoreductase [Micromonospora sp. WMMD1076]